MNRILRSPHFFAPFGVSVLALGLLFSWELGFLETILPSLSRPPATFTDIFFMIVLGQLLSFTTGLAVWNARNGNCPLGVKSATGVAGVLGAITLICPICIVLPASLLGAGFILTFLAPFLPLLRVIAIILLCTSIGMLWPKKG